MQIVQGEYYKTRDGRKVGPIGLVKDTKFGANEFWEWAVCEPEIRKGTLNWWTKEGGWEVDGRQSPLDIISLWSEASTSPVREVTKREIVPGVYGRVVVEYGERSPHLVGVMMNGAFIGGTELRAAAAVLLKLAGALDD